MMSVFVQATKNTINNTFKDKLKSIKKPSTYTTLTKDKLCSKIKRLEQQLAATTKTGEGTKTPPQNGPKEWQHKNVGPSVKVDYKTWWWRPKHCGRKGLYVRHKPENHSKWVEAKKKHEGYSKKE